eukprot:GHUV01029456.1.p4 GENE.GHUV01029456.1~~GHUV01029456.1.p4  ORF type:complete len:102 (+),score=6.99 GHUV01029456.1:820-1125(+)
MDRIQRMLAGMQGGGGQGGPPGDTPQVDTAEQIYISSLALLKMLKHGEPATTATTCSGVISYCLRATVAKIVRQSHRHTALPPGWSSRAPFLGFPMWSLRR